MSLLKLLSIKSVIQSNRLIFCHLFLLLLSILPSIRVFSNESAFRIKWPKYWSLSFSISPSNEYSGLIPIRIGWFDLLAVQVTLKSPLQHYNLKASILWHLALFMAQLSYLYVTTGGGNGTSLQYSCFVKPINSMKRQIDMKPEDERPRSEGVQYATGEEQRIALERMEMLWQSRNDAQLWICLVVKVKFNAVKNSIA